MKFEMLKLETMMEEVREENERVMEYGKRKEEEAKRIKEEIG